MKRRDLLLSAFAALPAPREDDRQNLLWYQDRPGRRHAVRTKADWQQRRALILENLQLVMGPLPRIDHKRPVEVQVLHEERTEHYTWKRITYLAEPGDRVPAYLYIPHNLKPGRRVPGIVSLHGTGYAMYVPMNKTPGDRQYAQELATRGYIVMAPDYLLLNPDYTTDPAALGYVSGTMKGIVNHIRAVDVLASLPQVDSTRIAAIGLSLGGHNSLFLAAFEPRVKAIVTSAGFNSFPKYYGGNLKGWTSTRYMPRIASVYESRPDRMPFDFPEILGLMAPRPLFINAPLSDANFEVSGVRDCVAAALPLYQQVFGAADRLVAQYPEGGHGFSEPARLAAYAFLEKWLGQANR